MKISFQHPDGNWHQFPQDQIGNILQQQSDRALRMLASFLPVVMEHDGGYICTKGLYPTIRKKHKNCVTFDTLIKGLKAPSEPLYKTLKISINLL